MMTGDNELRHLRNIFIKNGYTFWGYTLSALITMRGIQNFMLDKCKLNKNKTSPKNNPGWRS